jgi:hypothetical protein
MTYSLYKATRSRKLPLCAICLEKTRGRVAQLELPYGVKVWLCHLHRSLEFQRARGGRDFAVSLMRVWSAAGCMDSRRHRAIDAHLHLFRDRPHDAVRPGSYAWPAVRREVEERLAGGEPIGRIIDDVRLRFADGPAVPPSARTMQRWSRERRWVRPHRGRVRTIHDPATR